MRLIILIAVVVVLAAIALLRPRTGIYSYVWFALMRPDFYAWAQGKFPFAPLLAAATLVGAVSKLLDFRVLFSNFTSIALLVYQLPILGSVLFSVAPILTYQPFGEFERIVLMVLLIPVLIQTEQDMRKLCLVIAISLGMVALKFGLFGLRHGGVHIYEGYAGLDNNGLALALAMLVPFCWYMRDKVESKWLKGLLLTMVFSCITSIMMTKSRNGTLSLLTVILLIAWRSKHKVAVLGMYIILAVPAFVLFQDQFVARMSTLENVSADDSAVSRWVETKAAFQMWKDHPWFGVGFGNEVFMALEAPYLSVELSSTQYKAHNTYAQVLVDSGIFAFIIFVVMLFGTIAKLGASSRYWRKRNDPDRRAYPMMLQCGLIAVAQYGIAGGRERYDFLYIILMSAAAWFNLEKKLRLEDKAVPAEAVASQAASTPVPGRPWVKLPVGATSRASLGRQSG